MESLVTALTDPGAYIDAITLGAIYALIAVGYTMVYGIIKLINFAHGEVIMLGTYFALLVMTELSLEGPLAVPVAMAFAMLGCALVGMVLDWSAYLPLRRAKPLPDWLSLVLLVSAAGFSLAYFVSPKVAGQVTPRETVFLVLLGITLLGLIAGAVAEHAGGLRASSRAVSTDRLAALITAIGMSLCLQTVAMLLWTPNFKRFPEAATPAFYDQKLIRMSEDAQYLQGKELITWIAALVLMVALIWLVHHTRIGKAMRACALDQQTAALMGINVNHVIGFTFIVGSAMAAVAGILYSVKVGGNINPRMGYYPGVIAFAAAVLGGIGNLKGAVLGGLIIGFTQTFGAAVRSEYDMAFAFGLMIAFILFRPWGILGQREAKRA